MSGAPEPSEVARRLSCLVAGILFSYLLAVVGVVYGATTWERPHRDVLFALILVAVGVSSLLWLPPQRIVRAPWWAAFFCAWSVIDVCVLLELAWLDGGAGSPMALCLVLPAGRGRQRIPARRR